MDGHKLTKEEVHQLIYNSNTGHFGKNCPKCRKIMHWMVGREQYVCLNYSCEDYLELRDYNK